MDLTRLPALSLRDLADANPQTLHRTPGVHVTDVIRRQMAKIDPGRYGGDRKAFDADTSENWQEAGFMWEELLSAIFARRAAGAPDRFRPGEVMRDGIIGSPDALVGDPELGLVLEEYKCTWKSSRSFDLYDKRYLPWLLQIQAYLSLVDLTVARLYVFHINGNYEGYIPQVHGFLLQFHPRELRDTWASLLNTARAEGLR